MSNLILVDTADGSRTIYNVEVGENYHSRHGAVQESRHVFLQSGLIHFLGTNHAKEASVLEVGFGTGLNFLLSADFALANDIQLSYTGIEAFPLSLEMISETGYEKYVSPETWDAFVNGYSVVPHTAFAVSEYCRIELAVTTLAAFRTDKVFDVIYFDAFAAIHQPEMWTEEIVKHVCSFIKPGGIFVTYAITGNLKRTMKSIGFKVEKAPGAPGKREMLRAVKI